MTPSESFDPRTWQSSAGSPSVSREAVETSRPDAPPVRASWAGFALSAALLLAGAVAAYAMREPAPDVSAAALSEPD